MALLQEDNVFNKQDIKTIFEEIDKIKSEMKKFVTQDEFNLLRSRVDGLESNLAAIKKALGELEKKMKNQRGGGADQDAVDALNEELKKLRQEFE